MHFHSHGQVGLAGMAEQPGCGPFLMMHAGGIMRASVRTIHLCASLGKEGACCSLGELACAMCRETHSLVAFAMLDEGAGTELVTGSVCHGAHLPHVM